MLNALMHVSINAPESSKCGDVVKAAIDHWLKQKPRRKLKRAAASSKPEVNLESSQVQVPERETLNTLEEIEESDDLKGAEVAILEEPEESLHEIEAAAAEEEAATFATAIELPEPDLDYDSAIESDFESEDEFWQHPNDLEFLYFFHDLIIFFKSKVEMTERLYKKLQYYCQLLNVSKN